MRCCAPRSVSRDSACKCSSELNGSESLIWGFGSVGNRDSYSAATVLLCLRLCRSRWTLNALLNHDSLMALVIYSLMWHTIQKASLSQKCAPCTAMSGVDTALLAAALGLLDYRLILLAQMLPEHSPGIPLGWWAQSVKWWKDDFVPVITVCKLLSLDCKGSHFLITLVPRCLMVDVLLFQREKGRERVYVYMRERGRERQELHEGSVLCCCGWKKTITRARWLPNESSLNYQPS